MHILAAIDAGMGAFKYCAAPEGKLLCGLVDSVLAAPRRLGYGEKPHLNIKLDGVTTVIGVDARSGGMPRSCWSSGKVSADVKVLALSCFGLLAQQLQQSHLDIRLAGALPVGLWDAQRESFAQLICGNHHFEFCGKPISAQVDFHPDAVVPEPYCTYPHVRGLGLVGEEDTIGIVDIGHSTLDFALIDTGGRFVASSSKHQDIGMRVFYQKIADDFAALTGQHLDEVFIEQLYMEERFYFDQLGQRFDLSDIFSQGQIHYGQKVLNAMLALWKGVPLNRLVLTGGGAKTVLPVFAASVANKLSAAYGRPILPEQVIQHARLALPESILIVAPEARTANVRGLFRWLSEKQLSVLT